MVIIAAKPCHGWDEETITRAGKDLRLTDKQPPLNTLQPYRHPQSQSWPSPVSIDISLCSFVIILLGKAVPADHFHSMMSKSTHSEARQVWVSSMACLLLVQVTYPQ